MPLSAHRRRRRREVFLCFSTKQPVTGVIACTPTDTYRVLPGSHALPIEKKPDVFCAGARMHPIAESEVRGTGCSRECLSWKLSRYRSLLYGEKDDTKAPCGSLEIQRFYLLGGPCRDKVSEFGLGKTSRCRSRSAADVRLCFGSAPRLHGGIRIVAHRMAPDRAALCRGHLCPERPNRPVCEFSWDGFAGVGGRDFHVGLCALSQ